MPLQEGGLGGDSDTETSGEGEDSDSQVWNLSEPPGGSLGFTLTGALAMSL